MAYNFSSGVYGLPAVIRIVLARFWFDKWTVTCVNADVLYQTSHALVGIATVAALVLSIAGPLQAVHLHIWLH